MTKKVKILVVDDEEDLRENLKYVLKAKDYDVQLAEDGLIGLRTLDNYKPNLIILDMNMPNMPGIEFYKKICGYDGKPKYPVLVLTARANMEKLFKEFEVDGFMPKPFEIDDLVQKVEDIIKKRLETETRENISHKRIRNKIFITDDDPKSLNTIAIAFLSAGYTVSVAKNGLSAISLIPEAFPDIALIQLYLKDTPGTIVIKNLRDMPKGKIPMFILYTKTITSDMRVTVKVREQVGLDTPFINTNRPSKLLEIVNSKI